MKECIFNITYNRQIAYKTFEMTLLSQKPHEIKAAGQFVNIKLDGFFLRRPISICHWTENAFTIIYKVVGKGTEQMSKYEPGNKLSLLFPLGNGFDICADRKIGKTPMAIGGGAGVAPIYGLCKLLKEQGKHPIAILGFQSSKDVFYEEKFKELGVQTIFTTVDGSKGMKGFVTDAISDIPASYFYACGPEPLLKALDQKLDQTIDGQMSFEERMGCGFGACMGCSCKTKYGNKRICKEGPVLNREEVIW